MSGTRHGKGAYIALSTASTNTTPKSIQGADATFPQTMDAADVTVWSTNAFRSTIPGFKATTITFSGPWTSTKDIHLSTIFGATGITFHYGPEGSATGRRKKKGTGYLREYEVRSPVGDAVTFSGSFEVTSVVTSTVF